MARAPVRGAVARSNGASTASGRAEAFFARNVRACGLANGPECRQHAHDPEHVELSRTIFTLRSSTLRQSSNLPIFPCRFSGALSPFELVECLRPVVLQQL